ncbi:MAG: methyltransferase family protein [Promethearchaeota archaeon]
MSEHRHGHLAGEMPSSHTYQMALLVIFLVVWGVDSFLLRFTTFLVNGIPIWFPIIPAAVVFAAAVYFMNASHKDLFDTHEAGLATGGVFARVRHPMYLGTHLFYLALAIGTLSLASIVMWIITFAFYNVLANYEERLLEERFGEEFLEYKKKVRKWLPL